MTAGVRVLWMPGKVRTEIHLRGVDTDGAFCLVLDEPPPGWSLARHLHRDEAETIHVLDGDFEVEVDGESTLLGPGRSIHIPRCTPHSTRNVGVKTGRRLIMFSPAGMERFFTEIGRTSPNAEFVPAIALAAAERHGWEFTD